METTTDVKISPVEALWALYQAQTKKVKKILRKRILEEERDEEEKAFQKYVASASFLAHVSKVRKEYQEGKTTTCNSLGEIEAHLDSL